MRILRLESAAAQPLPNPAIVPALRNPVDSTRAPVVPARPRAGLILWLLAGAFVAVYLPAARWLVHRWSLGVWYHTHGFLVFPIAAWLGWARLRATAGAPADASALGFVFLVPAVLVQAADAVVGFQLPSAISLVLAVPGLSLLLLGRARTRAILFPICFLAFAVPVPLMVVRRIHVALRHVAAGATETALSALGYEVSREGTTLSVGPESIQIADACSGFSTLMALLMVGTLIAYLARAHAWRRVALVAVSLPAAALANALRCVFLCMLVTAYGHEVLDTIVHPLSGFGTFALAFGLLHLAERALVRRDAA